MAYPRLIKGDNPTREIHANLSNPHEVYQDLAIRLSEADYKRMGGLKGKKVCVEHDENIVIGEIAEDWIADDMSVWSMARVYTDTDQGEEWAEKLDKGKIGLSKRIPALTSL